MDTLCNPAVALVMLSASLGGSERHGIYTGCCYKTEHSIANHGEQQDGRDDEEEEELIRFAIGLLSYGFQSHHDCREYNSNCFENNMGIVSSMSSFFLFRIVSCVYVRLHTSVHHTRRSTTTPLRAVPICWVSSLAYGCNE